MPVKIIMQKESKSRKDFAKDPLSLGQISTLYGLKMRKKNRQTTCERKVYKHDDFGAICYDGYRHSLCHGWSSGVIKFIKENC